MVKENFLLKRTLIKIFVLLLFFISHHQAKSQIVYLSPEVPNFIPANIDSVFIFSENLAVTARGENLKRLQFKNNEIHGDDIPPTLRLKNPIGAILYHKNYAFVDIPVIIGRLNKTMPLDQLVREYFLNRRHFKGQSEMGGIQINVWQVAQTEKPYLVFIQDGRIIGNIHEIIQTNSIKNYSNFRFEQFVEFEKNIAGVWIYPPGIGNDQITYKILKLLQSGPLLVEYWDGLVWQFFEEAFLSQVIENEDYEIQMAYSLFPPKTEINYTAMISGGFTDIEDRSNLFSALKRYRIKYKVLEGEKLTFDIPDVMMHIGRSPEDTDFMIYKSALSLIENSDVPFLFLHYHGLDDLNHTFGPNDSRTVKHFKNLWDWHNQLRQKWYGKLLIVSDHGAHLIKKDEITNNETKGYHGDFIFQDMAVPIIEQKGLEDHKTEFSLNQNQVEQIWNRIGTPLQSTDEKVLNQPGTLEIKNKNKSKLVTIQNDSHLFSQDFYFEYSRKGKTLRKKFKGIHLINLLEDIDPASIEKIIAYSFDNHQVVYSHKDLTENELVVGLKINPENLEDSFTLYPLKDKFPNRMMKQLKRIEVF